MKLTQWKWLLRWLRPVKVHVTEDLAFIAKPPPVLCLSQDTYRKSDILTQFLWWSVWKLLPTLRFQSSLASSAVHAGSSTVVPAGGVLGHGGSACLCTCSIVCFFALPPFLCRTLSVFVRALPDLCYSPSIVKEVLSKIPTHWWVLMRCIPRD